MFWWSCNAVKRESKMLWAKMHNGIVQSYAKIFFRILPLSFYMEWYFTFIMSHPYICTVKVKLKITLDTVVEGHSNSVTVYVLSE